MRVSSLSPAPTAPVQTRYRRIRTPIPAPESIDLLEGLRRVEPRSMLGMPPVVWDQAEGFLVRDPYGNQWIDLTSGIIVANAGHSHPRILEAIREQLDSQMIFSYAFPTRQRQQVLERLVDLAPPGLSKALLFSSGTEATECCFSLMRKHGLTKSREKLGVLSFEGSYSGRTLSAKFAGGSPGLVDGLERGAAFHTQLPFPGGPESGGFCADIERRGIKPETTAGIIFESVSGWSTTPHPQEYVDELIEWARQHDVLVSVDEVQAGMGRSGRWFAFERYGITPDLIACGKGLTSSLPASAVIGRADVMDLAELGEMASTFGGNPVSAAAVLANLDVLRDEKLVERSARLGEDLGAALRNRAERHQRHVGRLDGRGLFYSLHLKDPETGDPLVELCDELATECVRRGVMMFVTGKGFLKFAPPLSIERDALLEAADVVGDVLDEMLP